MLAGHPFAGKSMLVAGLLKALDGGDPFLGSETKRSSALLVTEEDSSLLRERAAMFGLLDVESEFVSRAGSVVHEWPELVSLATERAVGQGHRLLVIDTFPGLAGLTDEQENDAGAIGQRLRPLQQAAGQGLAVLFLHHMNGQGQPRGSKAFRGVVDISVRLQRPERSRTLTLDTTSRSATGTPPLLRAELIKAPDGWFYEARGSGLAEKGGERREGRTDELLRAALVEACPEGITHRQLSEISELSLDKAKKRLAHWHKNGLVQREGKGGKGDPYRWLLCA